MTKAYILWSLPVSQHDSGEVEVTLLQYNGPEQALAVVVALVEIALEKDCLVALLANQVSGGCCGHEMVNGINLTQPISSPQQHSLHGRHRINTTPVHRSSSSHENVKK